MGLSFEESKLDDTYDEKFNDSVVNIQDVQELIGKEGTKTESVRLTTPAKSESYSDPEKLKITPEEQEEEAKTIARMETLLKMKTKRYRTSKRTIFFQGTAFVVEEEISIDSDESVSLATSDDSYLTDDSGVKEDFLERIEERKRDFESERAKEN